MARRARPPFAFLLAVLTVGLSVAIDRDARAQESAPEPKGPPKPGAPPGVIEVNGPREKNYAIGDPIPFAYHLEERHRLAPLLTGGLLLGSFYHATVVMGAAAGGFDTTGSDPESRALFVPLIGPFIYAASKGGDDGIRAFAIAFGLGQTASMTILMTGILWKPIVLVRDDSGPPVLDYEEGDRVPWNYHVEKRSRRGLVSFGATAFLAAYFASTTAAAFVQCPQSEQEGCTLDDDRGLLLVPVAGSFIGLTRSYFPGVVRASAFLLGALQLGGVASFITGVIQDEEVLVRDDVHPGRRWTTMIDPVPLIGPGMLGLALDGRF